MSSSPREQPYGFSPVWVRTSGATLLWCLNRFAHIEQTYGFAPVWVRSCRATLICWANRFGHIE